MTRIFIGDCGEYLASQVQQQYPDAWLVDSSNYRSFLQSEDPGTVYTSLADLPSDQRVIYQILDQADHIHYIPPQQWSDGKMPDPLDPTASTKGFTEYVLLIFQHLKNNVTGLDLSGYDSAPYLRLQDQRRSDQAQIWQVGASTTLGVGVAVGERYGDIIGEALEMPTSWLAASGSSVQWMADQVLRSDIRENDLVIVGIPDEARMPVWQHDLQQPIHLCAQWQRGAAVELCDLSARTVNEMLADETCFYQSLLHLHQIQHFCLHQRARLLLLGLAPSDRMSLYLAGIPQFRAYRNPQSPTSYIDFGTDNQHAGPKQHRLFADFSLRQLKHLNYI